MASETRDGMDRRTASMLPNVAIDGKLIPPTYEQGPTEVRFYGAAVLIEGAKSLAVNRNQRSTDG